MIGSWLRLFAYLCVLSAFAVSLWMLAQRGKPAGLSTAGLSPSKQAEAELTKSFLLLFFKKEGLPSAYPCSTQRPDLAGNAARVRWAMPAERPALRLSPARLFLAFAKAGLMGFGGVLPMIRLVMVEETRWQTAAEFSDMIAICQFLPGANVANLAVIFGSRTGGLMGGASALAGLLGAPVAIVLVLAGFYDRYGSLPVVRHGVAGLSAGAAGLILATAVRVALPLRGSWRGIAMAAASFTALGVLHLPFLPAVAALAALSIALALRASGHVTGKG
jgi:chromate transporter